MADSPNAPLDKAVALKYNKGVDLAPRVVASGQGFIAEQIITLAKEHGLPIHQDADLVEVLEKVELDTPIPLEAFSAVAEILVYIFQKNHAMK